MSFDKPDCFFREEQIQNSIFEDDKSRIRVGIVSNVDEPVYTRSVLSIAELFEFVLSAGILEGESYNEVCYGLLPDGRSLFEFIDDGISQFQVVLDLQTPDSFKLNKRASQFAMLQENRDSILQENGDVLLIQGLVP